ncbi:MAG: septation protein SpoVG [Oscillospiraceae bacterium]|nr:MAG: septation protein SpoVG [Oscillospiraceae bacterium]
MNITGIKIRRTYEDSRLRALVSLTLEGDFAVHDIKIIEGAERLFVAMPSRRDEQGNFRDICHPITAQARQILESEILSAYHEYLRESGRPDSSQEEGNLSEHPPVE